MEHIATFLLASLGLACIYAGYRLFCGLPATTAQGRPAARSTVFLLNILPGALLALGGTALLTTQARAMMAHRPAAVEHREPAAQGTSWHPGAQGASDRSA